MEKTLEVTCPISSPLPGEKKTNKMAFLTYILCINFQLTAELTKFFSFLKDLYKFHH